MTDRGDADPGAGSSGICRPLGRGLPGRPVLTSPPPGRLTSLRSRDLTLGGFKKKNFIPNVHSVRKSKDELKAEAHVVPKKDRRDREDRHRENRGKRRERPQTIQSHSIFEQGPADTITRKSVGWRGTDLSDSGSSPAAKCIKKERHASDDDENEILQKLQRDDFLDDPGLKNDAKNRPIQLPLYDSGPSLRTEAANPYKEDTTDTKVFRTPTTKPPRSHQRGRVAFKPEQPSVAELFQQLSVSEKEELLFIQLPDTMPGQPKTLPEKSAKKDSISDKRSSHIKAQEPIGKDSVPVLSDFAEGFVGKLQIRKSGKVQLALGDITMDVSDGAAFSFLQQLVSVRLSEGLTGDMSVLGNIKHKLVCSPDFEALLQGVTPSPDKRLANL